MQEFVSKEEEAVKTNLDSQMIEQWMPHNVNDGDMGSGNNCPGCATVETTR
jgi:hypothetical protein